MAKIGIYGGTFNPIHNTHLEIAETAMKQFNLDKLFFLIAGEPPHKETADSVNACIRLDMLKIALQDYPSFCIDDRELYRSGKSYSYLTLQEYSEEYPEDKLYFIMGSDSLLSFKNWVYPEKITQLADIIVAPRASDTLDIINSSITELMEQYSCSISILGYSPNNLASTTIRENYSDYQIMKHMVPKNVFEYIQNHNPYAQSYTLAFLFDIERQMKKVLKLSRFQHTIGVAHTCYNLALKWLYPANNAYLAGLLHDCAKCISDSERLRICKKNDIEITPIEKRFPHLLHGKVGAYFSKKKYKVDDLQICHAITIHTTGCPDMNLLDKILFVADYIEPNRTKQPRLDFLRSLAYEDLDLCVYLILEDTVNFLMEKPTDADPKTIETFEFYKKQRGIV